MPSQPHVQDQLHLPDDWSKLHGNAHFIISQQPFRLGAFRLHSSRQWLTVLRQNDKLSRIFPVLWVTYMQNSHQLRRWNTVTQLFPVGESFIWKGPESMRRALIMCCNNRQSVSGKAMLLSLKIPKHLGGCKRQKTYIKSKEFSEVFWKTAVSNFVWKGTVMMHTTAWVEVIKK